jgi:hypothetical protein
VRFRVRFRRQAREELTRIWLRAADRGAITRACDRIERALRHQPTNVGESRDGNLRFWNCGPLGVFFDVIEDKQIVIVRMIRPAAPRKKD